MSSEEEEDPWITRIKRSKCYNEHLALQDCHFETKDWRKCRPEMTAFKLCFLRNSPPEQIDSVHS
jgi:cytochrome c oxidase assembly factor 4